LEGNDGHRRYSIIAVRYGFARRMPSRRVRFGSGASTATSAKLPDIDSAATAIIDNILEVVLTLIWFTPLAVFYVEGQEAIHYPIVRPAGDRGAGDRIRTLTPRMR